MTLLMGDEWNKDERRVWTRTHKLIANALEIDKSNYTIFLRKGERIRESQRAVVGHSNWMPNEFHITVFDADPISMIAGFAHEKVHVKQYLRGELEEYSRTHSLWKGKPVRVIEPPFNTAFEELLYREQPWEKEAFARMEPLAQAAILALPSEDRKWFKAHYDAMEFA